MAKISYAKVRVARLCRMAEDGQYAIPGVQREFVWDLKRAAKLLDSICRGLPIGSLVIWRAGLDRKHQLRQTQKVIPAFDDRNREIQFIIDGQQRLAVFYRSWKGGVVEAEDREIDFDQLCLTFEEDNDSLFARVRRQDRDLHVPLPVMLSPNWSRKLGYLTKAKLCVVARCRQQIMWYSMPVITMRTAKLDEVKESFVRINSAGMRVSAADEIFGEFSKLRLRELVNELRDGLPHGYDSIDKGVLQGAAALIFGASDTRTRTVKAVFKKLEEEEFSDRRPSGEFTHKWRHASECIRRAIDFLQTELRVPGFDLLPSQSMLSALAYFFHANNRAQPSARQARELRKWFWATPVAGRYTGRGYDRNLSRDIALFKRLGRSKLGTFALPDRVQKYEVRRAEYSGAGLSTAFFLLLGRYSPRYLETGSRIPMSEVASAANRSDRHHIFPSALLARNRMPYQDANSLCNICYVVAQENQSIGSNRPSVYLMPYRRRKCFARVMKSHLIPYDSDSGLWDTNVRRGFKTFVRRRLDLICAAFEKQAGMRLFRED